MAPILLVGGGPPRVFHIPDKYLIVGSKEAGCGLPFISNNNNDDGKDDNSNHLGGPDTRCVDHQPALLS